MSEKRLVHIAIAEDDEDDQLLIKEAFEACAIRNPITFVSDGVELLDLLRREGKYKDISERDRPGLILLDLNMPRMDGREALKIIKEDPELKSIPVVALTTSKDQEDILSSYVSGVSSFITKPVSNEGLISVVKSLHNYWVEIVELPQV